ncbi:Mur ligase family protein [Arthrobacter psychrochitiniphilus]|uniref:UDP-N-acetylmuramyl-tripeptide synthetase n=1 Tax=Arthrobacter psychrochitiniphilus TaxID=291045 RepID=A0A2V3DSD0_9MICC|nr:UDP-N-acetylmuramoyl-L-alanyl-D-glutamate--2,6-diaminopimelate ligase [Arthrobacter psychrochitiniphilus]NYG17306.1 UDP-N-acetylmuramoyl-L-alanyl-D-glutamate--2,6-diaminopimelate ligase [Arthrobacter psychrochitiniphilus]PXA65428.1 UDP-N-acetylmuramoyl-L-alanyl-D-glutamate--2,6-diaminopimelate ligase [Arthrobacter psychrochitiniphilus]
MDREKEKDFVHVPVNNPGGPSRPSHHSGATLAELAEVAGAALGPALAAQGDLRITGVSLDSRTIHPGDLYLALPGSRSHGATFANAAVAAGALAIMTDESGRSLLGDSVPVPVLALSDVRAVAGPVAARVYGTTGTGDSGHRLELFGLTGTNGKTTTTYFLNSLLRALGHSTGLIGTIEILAGEEAIPSKLTTPESTDVHALLALMAEKDLSAASMEVSSHALAFGRVDGVVFDVAGFTNLTQDHLDLHGGMEGYFDTKAALFTPAHARHAVITVDDDWGRRMAEGASVPAVTLSTDPLAATGSAQWQVREVQREGVGSRFTLNGPAGAVLNVHTGLPGGFNVSNAALALLMVTTHLLGTGTGTGTGSSTDSASGAGTTSGPGSGVGPGIQMLTVLTRLQEALDRFDPFTVEVPGRMQLIGTAPVAVVDFAHNPDALARALDAVRPSAPDGRLIAVFGATGERDASKRPIMGAVVAQGADVVIITDDDPHDEDPAAIRAGVLAGAREADRDGALGRVIEECDQRATAILRAVELARAQDVILVAGRGHEVYQEVKGVNIALDDRVELRKALASRGFPLTGASKIESPTDD